LLLGNYKGNYLLDNMCGFKKNHMYELEINNNGRTYEIVAIHDYTDECTVDLYMRLSSENSIRRYFDLNA